MATPLAQEFEDNIPSIFGDAHKIVPTHDTNARPGSENNDARRDWLAVFDSILAAPLQVKTASPRFSDYLTSRIIAVVIKDGETYHLHSSLLCRESERMKRSLVSEHQEAQQLRIELIEESAAQFAQFIDFLYKADWEPTCKDTADLVHLATLYTMGERLIAQTFQNVILRSFITNLKLQSYNISNAQLCQLLVIACESITERLQPQDDPIRDFVFWLAASRLTTLQKSPEFLQILGEHNELGKQLIMRAGNCTDQMPSSPFTDQNDEVPDPWAPTFKSKKSKKTGSKITSGAAGWGLAED